MELTSFAANGLLEMNLVARAGEATAWDGSKILLLNYLCGCRSFGTAAF
jgi:hypothetical protein